jgi:hypothetical protein
MVARIGFWWGRFGLLVEEPWGGSEVLERGMEVVEGLGLAGKEVDLAAFYHLSGSLAD